MGKRQQKFYSVACLTRNKILLYFVREWLPFSDTFHTMIANLLDKPFYYSTIIILFWETGTEGGGKFIGQKVQ